MAFFCYISSIIKSNKDMSKANTEVITRMNEQLDQLLGSKEANQYTEQLKYDRFEKIMNTQEYLNAEESEFCINWDSSVKEDLFYIGDYSSHGKYLNLRLYSEHDNYNGDDCNV